MPGAGSWRGRSDAVPGQRDGSSPRFSSSRAARAPHDRPTVATLRLHRVMTDDLEIVAPDGGDFDYRIVLPG